MCLGAIYWARPRAVYFCATQHDAADAGFDDHFIYQELALPPQDRKLITTHINLPDRVAPFQAWAAHQTKIRY
jgi:guanine deaminase